VGEEEPDEDRQMTTADDQKAIEALFLKRITALAKDGTLLEAPNLLGNLFDWSIMSNDGGVETREWTSHLLTEDVHIPVLARAFLGHSWSQGGGSFGGLSDLVARKNDRAQISGANQVIDLEKFKQRLEEWLDEPGRQEEDRDVVSRLLAVWDVG
jgi:hypothetical protein